MEKTKLASNRKSFIIVLSVLSSQLREWTCGEFKWAQPNNACSGLDSK